MDLLIISAFGGPEYIKIDLYGLKTEGLRGLVSSAKIVLTMLYSAIILVAQYKDCVAAIKPGAKNGQEQNCR